MKNKTLRIFTFFAISFASIICSANENKDHTPKLTLACVVSIKNFEGIEHASTQHDIALSSLKHKKNGAKLVTQTDNFEFWAMIHGSQKANNIVFYKNFQVAIFDKKSNRFYHALSDENVDQNTQPKRSRLSIVEYHENSFLESGELLFECIDNTKNNKST